MTTTCLVNVLYSLCETPLFSKLFYNSYSFALNSSKCLLGSFQRNFSNCRNSFTDFQNFTKSESPNKRIIILGTGWASIHFFKNLRFENYEVVVVSPRNYFTFTPLLPSVCSGTLSPLACIEPVRKFTRKNGKLVAGFFECFCTDINFKEKKISCESGEGDIFLLYYDYIIIGIGAETNTFNIPGVSKYACFLKEVEHAIEIRKKIMNNFERAALPTTSADERERLLHFVVVGGGPTGVESAAEFADFAREDMSKYFPELLRFFKVTIVEANKKLLPMFTLGVSSYTKEIFEKRLNIQVMLEHVVTEIKENSLILKNNISGADSKIVEIPYGILLWASGIKQVSLAKKIINFIPQQKNASAILVNERLEVLGAENAYAFGDCSFMKCQKLSENAEDFFEKAKRYNENCYEWLESNSKELSKTYPQLSPLKWNFKNKAKPICNTFEEFKNYLNEIDLAYKSPAPTAQNARMQGKYLANIFNTYISLNEKNYIPIFNETWSGSLAYVGANQAVANMPYFDILGGFYSLLLWKAAYIQMQLTWRSRTICLFDWLKTFFAGRDVGRDHTHVKKIINEITEK